MMKASCALNKYSIFSSMTIFFSRYAQVPASGVITREGLLTDNGGHGKIMLDPEAKMNDISTMRISR